MGLFGRKKSNQQAASHNLDTSDHNGQHPAANGSAKAPADHIAPNGTFSHRAATPEIPIPKAPDPGVDPAGYLRSIYAVRERNRIVLEKAKRNELVHFHVDMSKFADTASYVVSIIKVRFLG